MNWSNKLNILEKEYNWKDTIVLYENNYENIENENKLNFILRIMFLLNYILIEFKVKEDQLIINKLGEIFKENREIFINNPDFLFCMAIIFQLNEFPFDINLNISEEYFCKAANNSNFILFKLWIQKLGGAEIIISEIETDLIYNWKKKKGLLGEYVFLNLNIKQKK